MFKFFLGFIKGELLKRFSEFQWAEREKKSLRDAGYSDEDIQKNILMNRVALPAWLERQVK
jgi:hypothetical protein